MAHIYCNLSGIHLNTHIRILCRHTLNKDKKANKSVMIIISYSVKIKPAFEMLLRPMLLISYVVY